MSAWPVWVLGSDGGKSGAGVPSRCNGDATQPCGVTKKPGARPAVRGGLGDGRATVRAIAESNHGVMDPSRLERAAENAHRVVHGRGRHQVYVEGSGRALSRL